MLEQVDSSRFGRLTGPHPGACGFESRLPHLELNETFMQAALNCQAEVQRVRRALPIPYVLAYAGLAPYEEGARVKATCPFHDDRSPSLDVWQEADGLQRWGCWPCGKRGDVFDLIRWLWGLASFHEAVKAAEALLPGVESWHGPTTGQAASWDDHAMNGLWLESYRGWDPAAVERLIAVKGWRFGPGLLRELMVGTARGRLVVPYFDADQRLVALKHRSLAGDDKMMAMPGSQLRSSLYNQVSMRAFNTTLICEGESDTWTALSNSPAVAVVGLPSGAGTPPTPFVEQLAGRRVYLAFDGDEAGRTGSTRWAAALTASEVIQVQLPDGHDVTSVGSVDWLRSLT